MAKKQSTGSAYGDKMRSDWERTHTKEYVPNNVQKYNRAKQPSVGEPRRFTTSQELNTVPQPKSSVTPRRRNGATEERKTRTDSRSRIKSVFKNGR